MRKDLFFREYDPRHDVDDQSRAGRKQYEPHPDQTDKGDIHIEVFGKTGTDTRDFFCAITLLTA